MNVELDVLESNMSNKASANNGLEYETLLDSSHDMNSTSSSTWEVPFDDYFKLRCGKINPVQDILNQLSEQNVRNAIGRTISIHLTFPATKYIVI